MKNSALVPLGVIFAFFLSGCSAATPPPAATVIVTVVSTIPVEVTRVVEVQRTVEVTREVVLTQIVEVPVTVTPSPSPQLSPTPTVLSNASGPRVVAASPSPTFPREKVEGFSHLKLVNQTADNLVVGITGPFEHSYALSADSDRIVPVMEGNYTYTVWRQEQVLFTGQMNITNPDKHELHIRQDKVVFLVP
ncbi:MAG: hypothetical protein P8X95_24360 [Anaerolineales bacterium]|jgi:hypothetical protein